VLDVRIDPQFLNRTPEQISDLHRRIREQLLQTPGVVQAALAFYTPFSGIVWQSDMVIPGYTGGREPNRGHVTWIRVSPGYFEAAGIPVLAGRTIGEQDTAGRPRVVVISEGTRDKYFGGQNPIGRRIRFEAEPQEDDFEVIGVVGNVKVNSVREELMPTVYVSLDQKSAREATDKFIDPSFTAHDVVVRVSGDPAAMEDRVRKALQQVDPELPVSRIATFGERVALSLGRERMLTMLSVSFGVLALLLACVGLYGLMSYSLARRTKEFGIRIALGASPGRILSFVFGEVLALLIAGIVIGVPLVIGGTRYATSLLYGISARDPRMIVAATVVLAVVAVAAGFVPARRATRVDPMVSLRIE
jgi:predicted permease